MPEFLQLTPPQQALNRLLDILPVALTSEIVPLGNALGRVTA